MAQYTVQKSTSIKQVTISYQIYVSFCSCSRFPISYTFLRIT